MPAWTDLLTEVESVSNDQKGAWINARLTSALQSIGVRRGGRNVILYGSAFLQKPTVSPSLLQLTHEEINGFMSVLYGMKWAENLTLILHTPGGVTNAAETIVAYLCSKFQDIEVIVPTYAMSAGTMISLASQRIVMGRQSQLGPIDPQMPVGGRFISARAIVDQFDRAKSDILADRNAAHAWAPVLQAVGPALLQEAQNALEYGERMVAGWLRDRMFAPGAKADARAKAAADEKSKAVAAYFNDAANHKSHGRRIDRLEAEAQGVSVEPLEASQELQEDVLTAYHVMTILFEKTQTAKMLMNHQGKLWIKNA
jgi:hypothetical protein